MAQSHLSLVSPGSQAAAWERRTAMHRPGVTRPYWKLELQRLCSQAGAWEPAGVPGGPKPLEASCVSPSCRGPLPLACRPSFPVVGERMHFNEGGSTQQPPMLSPGRLGARTMKLRAAAGPRRKLVRGPEGRCVRACIGECSGGGATGACLDRGAAFPSFDVGNPKTTKEHKMDPTPRYQRLSKDSAAVLLVDQ